MQSCPIQSLVASRRGTGFSLIELLVVLLIIGLGVGLVSVRIGDNSAYQLRMDAKLLANNAALISEEAVLSGDQWGIDLYLDESLEQGEYFGYRWLHREQQNWQVKGLAEIESDTLLRPGLRMQLELEGVEQEIGFKQGPASRDLAIKVALGDEPLEPDIWLLSSGEVTPFRLTLIDTQAGELRVIIMMDQLGRIELQTDEDQDLL